ncbi:MAG: ribokinase [Pseudomonadota bacterium]
MGKIAVLGVFVADLAFRADRMPVMGETLLGNSFAMNPGGKGSNQAVAAARMGADVTMITRLGADNFAQMAHELWRADGITPAVTEDADSYTGAAHIFVDEASGDNAIIIAPGAAADLSESDLSNARESIENADVFVTQLEQPLEAAMRGLQIARAAGVTTILNPAPARKLPGEMLALCDYVTPNETETEILSGVAVETVEDAARACEALKALGVARPIITMGEQGAYLDGHGLVPAFRAGEVVETTGAGDAFNGGFAACLAESMAPEDAAHYACAVAGLSVTRAGAAPSMPKRDEVLALLQGPDA